MPKYDVSELLTKQFETDRFINSLNVSTDKKERMTQARTKVRNALKSAFTRAKTHAVYLERLTEDQQQLFQNIEPRFWPQGSFAYGTQNLPAITPPQQLDIDDGIYLPIEAFRDKPVVLKEIFFNIVDTALKQLSLEQGWEFDGNKKTCARLILDTLTHLDVPLYVIPIERHVDLEKAVGRTAINRQLMDGSDEYGARRLLSDEEVYLAVRDGRHWVKSDPIKIQEWFEQEQQLFGDRLTRVCRYMKAWRDQTWADGGPSSIALMICCWQVFSESKAFTTDGEALYEVCKRLPLLLSQEVENPVSVDKEVIFPRGQSKDELSDIRTKVDQMSNEVCANLNRGNSRLDVVDVLRTHWGDRMPRRPDWVSSASALATSILNTPAEPQRKPKVSTMRSALRSG